jgi:pimeloyl-ACP methyl ester carboxylesterase
MSDETHSEHHQRILFIHGLEGTSHGFKAQLLRNLFPGMRIPDFRGALEERMQKLRAELEGRSDWIIIGSSLGGLMAAMYAFENPQRVSQLILLAPALIWPDFAQSLPEPINVPVTIFHGTRDHIIPLNQVRPIAEQIFRSLDFHVVDDDHGMHQTVQSVDWKSLIARQLQPGAEDHEKR